MLAAFADARVAHQLLPNTSGSYEVHNHFGSAVIPVQPAA
jgi:hypothetical protein